MKTLDERLAEAKPIFPLTFPEDTPEGKITWFGLTLRDYFAGQALVGLLSGCHIPDMRFDDRDELADYAYLLADEMLMARDKGGFNAGRT